jgi:hypothetical protein
MFAKLTFLSSGGQSGTRILTEHVYFLARLVMADRQIFLQLISVTASTQNKPESVLYEGLLDQWWTKVSPTVSNV